MFFLKSGLGSVIKIPRDAKNLVAVLLDAVEDTLSDCLILRCHGFSSCIDVLFYIIKHFFRKTILICRNDICKFVWDANEIFEKYVKIRKLQ